MVESITISASSHKGPLPRPELLEAYERVLPGLAERIIRHAEREQSHRHEINTRNSELSALELKNAFQVESDAHAARLRGQFIGFLGLLVIAIGGVWCAVVGAFTAASVFGGALMAGSALTVLVTGKHGKAEKKSEPPGTQLDAPKAQ